MKLKYCQVFISAGIRQTQPTGIEIDRHLFNLTFGGADDKTFYVRAMIVIDLLKTLLFWLQSGLQLLVKILVPVEVKVFFYIIGLALEVYYGTYQTSLATALARI